MRKGSNPEKELMDKIINEIPESIYTGSDEDIEIKLALYVYIMLGKMKSVDERIYWGNRKISYKLIVQSRKDSKDINKLAIKRKLTCISIANLYKKILNNFGIKCDAVRGDPPDVHLDNVITLKSGRRILADLQLDLYNIKTGRSLECFKAIGKEDFLKEDVLTHFLMEVGYIFDGESYRQNKTEDLKRRIELLPEKEALADILGSEEIYRGIENLDVSEAYVYYREMIAMLLGKERFRKIYEFPCYVMDKHGEPKYSTFCIFADTGNYKTLIPYLYSKKHGRMMVCDLETLDRLQKEGLYLGRGKLSKGRKRINSYIERFKTGKIIRGEKDEER